MLSTSGSMNPMDAPEPSRQRRLNRLAVFLSVYAFAILVAYVASYACLSPIGMRESRPQGCLDGFLYIPFEEASAKEDLTAHHRLATFYAPLNWIDREVFGGGSPILGIMWRLADETPPPVSEMPDSLPTAEATY